MNLEEFHFIRPYWLLAIVPLVVMLWLLLRRQFSSGNWATVCDPQLLPHILLGGKGKRRTWPFYVLGIGGLLSILALAGPTWERLPQPAFRDQSALVIVLDLSHSMDATDIKPSRLVRARFKVADMLKQRQEGQTALVIYAGDAFTVTPLTDDTETIASQLSVLNTSLVPSQGSRVDIALEKAAALLKQAGLKKGDVLLMTDGVNEKRANMAVEKLEQYKLSILGIGTGEGSPIPLGNGSFLTDAKGAIVIPKLEEHILREVAQNNGGIYQQITTNDSDVLALHAFFDDKSFKNQEDTEDLQIDTWREYGPWLLLLVLPLAALAFRRGYLVVILLFFMPLPRPTQAFDWNNLWVTPDQQASEAYKKEDMQQAAELFDDPEWKATAQYKSGQYEKSIKSLEGLEGAENWYNKGNAFTQLGRYPEAIEAYKKALELEPAHEDAKYNKESVEKQLEQNKQNKQDSEESQQSQDSQESQESENDAESKESEESQESDSQDAQNSESQSEEQQKSEQASEKKGESEDPSDEAAKPQQAEPQDGDEQQSNAAQQSDTELDETQQAHEQWLRKIPDDPGGLLRRKFKYQYQQRNRQSEEEPW